MKWMFLVAVRPEHDLAVAQRRPVRFVRDATRHADDLIDERHFSGRLQGTRVPLPKGGTGPGAQPSVDRVSASN